MKITSEELYDKLTNDYKIVGQTGIINFTLNDLSIEVENKDENNLNFWNSLK